jgi:glycosyltransferase involved in cell wall biosynthesis
MCELLIITATRGTGAWFGHTASSVVSLRKSGVNVRWVIVCPIMYVESINKDFPWAECIAENKRGLYTAINQGVEHAGEGWEWFTYINDDDGFLPDLLESVKLLSAGGFDVLYGDVIYVDESGRKLGLASVCKTPRFLLNLFSQGIPPFTQQGTLVKREVFQALGGFSTTLKLASDSDFWARALLAGFIFRYEANLVAFYRRRLGQLSDEVGLMEVEVDHIRSTTRVAHKSFGRDNIVVFIFRLQNIFRIINRIFTGGSIRTSVMFRKK